MKQLDKAGVPVGFTAFGVKLYTPQEVVDILDITREALRKSMIEKVGGLKYVRLGLKVYISEPQLQDFLKCVPPKMAQVIPL